MTRCFAHSDNAMTGTIAHTFDLENPMSTLQPAYLGEFQPEFPCSQAETRHCPAILRRTCASASVPCLRHGVADNERVTVTLAAEDLWLAEM